MYVIRVTCCTSVSDKIASDFKLVCMIFVRQLELGEGGDRGVGHDKSQTYGIRGLWSLIVLEEG